MIKVSTAALLAVALLGSAAHADERNFPVASFDQLASAGSATVFVTTGKAASVHAEGSKDALDRLNVSVDGSTLRLGTKNGDWGIHWSSSKVKIYVTVPMLSHVDLAGSGSVSVDRIKVAQFSASISGSGAAKLAALDADTVKLSIAGSGEFDASGRCGDAHISVSGSGGVRMAGLRCTNLHASIAGSGDVDAFVTGTAHISVAGSGDAHIRGGAQCTTSKSGSGTVNCGS